MFLNKGHVIAQDIYRVSITTRLFRGRELDRLFHGTEGFVASLEHRDTQYNNRDKPGSIDRRCSPLVIMRAESFAVVPSCTILTHDSLRLTDSISRKHEDAILNIAVFLNIIISSACHVNL